MYLTVFTPTYNRGHLLEALYKSLLQQSNQSFEWIIVDDGSKDNTERIVAGFIARQNAFAIRYVKQENQGKHIAINKGVAMAAGTLFFVVDSDDILLPDSINTVFAKYQLIKDNPKVAGVTGRRAYPDGRLIGSQVMYDDITCNALDFRFKFHIQGDMAEVFRTDIIKKYPFPSFDGERFCPEALVFNRIAQKYDMLWFSEPIYMGEYLEGGLTSKITSIRKRSPEASALFYRELSHATIPFIQKFRAVINYWRFAIYIDKKFVSKWKGVNFIFSILAMPFIPLFFIKDR